jgi:hypothetical protein
MNPEVGVLLLVLSALSYPLTCAISCAVRQSGRAPREMHLNAFPFFDGLGW